MHLYLDIHFSSAQLLQAFSWMLVHSLWQGLLLALITAMLLQATKSASARLRYNIVFIQFVLFILACSWTFFRGLSGPSVTIVPLAGRIGQNASHLLNINAVSVRAFADACAAYISAHASVLVMIWAVFFTFRSFRMVQGLIYLQKTKSQYIPVAAHWHERLDLLCSKLQIKRSIRLLESARVKVPMVIGHLKPVILMPVGLLTGLPVEQIEAVLLHELAHIRRHDYLVNLLQTICETIFFFNPGLLWISALLRDEREHCCDDVALGQTGNKKEFIQALISFKEHALYGHSSAVAFPGKKNQLLQRVSRIINNKHQSLGTAEKVLFMVGIILLLSILSTAAITQLREIEHDIFSRRPAVPDTQQPLANADRPRPVADTKPAAPQHKHHTSTVTVSESVTSTHAADETPVEHPQPDEAPMEAPDVQYAAANQTGDAHEATDLSLRSEYRYESQSKDISEDRNISRKKQYTERSSSESRITFRKTQQSTHTVYIGNTQYKRENNYRPHRFNTLELSSGDKGGGAVILESVDNNAVSQLILHQANAQEKVAESVRQAQEQQKESLKLARLQADRDKIQADRDRQQAERDRKQAEKDREQAVRDRMQAEMDRRQADRDRDQAIKDRIQADKDREQAVRDRAQAEKDRIQAHLDRLQHENDRAKFEAEKKQRQTQNPVI